MESPNSGRRWPEAIVLLCGALPVVVTWLHAYSHTPPVHPQPSYALTVVIAALAALATPLVAWLLRRRLGGSWLAVAGIALAGPLLIVASGVMRARADAFPDKSAPVVGSVIAATGYLAVLTAVAALRLRRVRALLAPLVVAIAAGHVAYGLPGQATYEIWAFVGAPYATSDAATVIYGHNPHFD